MKKLAAVVVTLGLMAAAGAWAYERLRPRTLVLRPKVTTPLVSWNESGQPSVSWPGRAVVAEVAVFDDELYAYFNFDYLRSRSAVAPAEVLLTHNSDGGRPAYPVLLHLPNDMLLAIPLLESLRQDGYVASYEWRILSDGQLKRYQGQTRVFTTAYSLPVERRLEHLSQEQRRDIVERFVVFKSRTDPRIRRGIEPTPTTLTSEQAQRLAADILTVTDFFWLPLEFFLGIGAMENNYMDMPGDLQHAVWKGRAEPGDIVLRRRNGRVLVLNNATGVWQITRETLRYAHRLYREGDWDYTLLPEHLRPPEELNLHEVNAAHLTTYAGLLFRDLIDRFDGDVARAVGAYNGGPGKPNMRYEEGVRMVANYARRVVEQAARLNGQAVADMQFLLPAQ